MCKQHEGFAWDDTERGRFRQDFFPPVEIPVIEHKPWVQRNIPIPPGIFDEVCRIIRKKIEAGVYEPSNSSYDRDDTLWRVAIGDSSDGMDKRSTIFHDDVTYILQPEIPHITIPYIDDVPVRGPETRYELADGGYEVIRQIRAFVDLSGSTCIASAGSYSACDTAVSQKKHSSLATLYLQRQTSRRIAGQSDRKLGPLKDLSEVRAFLGTIGVVRIFIRNFAQRAHPLVYLTRKDIPFEFGPRQIQAQEDLKQALLESPALRAIDYTSDSPVILAVDTSYIAVGVRNLVIEVDARYIKGMLQNPDIAPRTVGRPRQPDDEDEPEDDFEDWIDRIHGFAHLVNPHPTQKVTRDSLVSIYTIDEPQPDSRHSSQVPEGEAESQDPPVDSYDIVPRSIQAIALDQSFYLFATGIEHSSDHHNSQMQTTRLLLSSQYNSSSTLTDFGSAIHTEHTNLSSHPKDVSIFCEHVTMK
ncbi:hypothetical protein A0H81_09645 [Grifola frondosa]|uniref:Reverse transcriptase/retrotransposon-derived protein RNase H-like domain-containing protein n=1 Tax=Grifola frondosa TaxID=5627 RepID=A0A1C7M5L8_GRIFR|nr:hypothetical protein A0H81_09645 [Grifola frondosa]